MSVSPNKPKLDNLARDIWKSAERLRGKFKSYEYQSVILPIIVIRRLECVLLAWHEAKRAEVMAKRPKLNDKDLTKLVKKLEGGDLDKLGRGYLWNGQIPNCLHQNHIFAVRCFPHKLRPMFLAYATASQYGRDYFEATGKRTTNLASTSSTKVGLFPIPLPPLTVQDEICSFLDAKLSELKRIAGGIEAQIEILAAYRKSLIHECVTGQWRVTDEDLRRVGAVQSTCAMGQAL